MQCNPKGFIFCVKDTLRTLKEGIINKAHLNVRFLPLLTFLFIAIFVPLSIKNNFLHIITAEANPLEDFAMALANGTGAIFFGFLKVISSVIFKLTGYIFGISAKIFENSVVYSLSGTLYSSFKFINVGWVFIRDLINSLFIFVVLYIAFQQLLKMDGGVDTKKLQSTLIKIIMAALLINFSLFFTKAAIDVSNFLSRAIYYQMENVSSDGLTRTYGPANALVAGLDIQTLLKDPVEKGAGFGEKLANIKDDQIIKTLVYLGGSAVHIIAAIMFFTMAFFFVARILVLIIIMLTSPMYFLSFILGNVAIVKKYTKMWYDQLVSQILFPIVFMLIIYIAVTFVNQGLLTKTSGNTLSSGITGDPSGFATIINFGIVLFIMYMATSTAKGQAGEYVNKWGEAAAGKVAAAGFSTAAWAGRNTFGEAGRRMSESNIGKNWASSNNRFAKMAGDSVIHGGKAMYEGNWDVRSAGPISDAYGFANKSTHNLKVGGPTTKNAKADVPEWWTKNKSKDGQVKEAARITKKVEGFTSIEAKVSTAKSKLGDKINNKEYKTVREKLITDIKTEYKDKPNDQEKLLRKLLGDGYNSVDNKAVRSEIELAQNKEAYKNITKEHIKASKELKEAEKAETKYKADNPNAKDVPDEIKSKLEKARAEAVSTSNKFKDITKKVPRDMVQELAVEDISHFKDQLTTAQLTSISKKMSDGGYVVDDVNNLNKFIKELRETTKDRSIREWINQEATKGTGGFHLRLESDVNNKLNQLKTEGRSSPGGIKIYKELEDIARVLSRNEIMALELNSIIQLSNEGLITVNRTNEFAKRVRNEGDPKEVEILDREAAKAEAASNEFGILPSEKDKLLKLAKAYRGKLKN